MSAIAKRALLTAAFFSLTFVLGHGELAWSQVAIDSLHPDAAAPGMNIEVTILGTNLGCGASKEVNPPEIQVTENSAYVHVGTVVFSHGILRAILFIEDDPNAIGSVNVTVTNPCGNATGVFQIVNAVNPIGSGVVDLSGNGPASRTTGGTWVVNQLNVTGDLYFAKFRPTYILSKGAINVASSGRLFLYDPNPPNIPHGGQSDGRGGHGSAGGAGGGGGLIPSGSSGSPDGGNGMSGAGGGSAPGEGGRGGEGVAGSGGAGGIPPSPGENGTGPGWGNGGPSIWPHGGGGGGGGSGIEADIAVYAGYGATAFMGAQGGAGAYGGSRHGYIGGGHAGEGSAGGGGGYGTRGEAKNSWSPGGALCGHIEIVPLAGGSGGGGGGDGGGMSYGGGGGGGGGAILVAAVLNADGSRGTISVAGQIVADGWKGGDAALGGGGGSGGAIVLQSGNQVSVTGILSASGGDGGAGTMGNGGKGGEGRVRMDDATVHATRDVPGISIHSEFNGPAITSADSNTGLVKGTCSPDAWQMIVQVFDANNFSNKGEFAWEPPEPFPPNDGEFSLSIGVLAAGDWVVAVQKTMAWSVEASESSATTLSNAAILKAQ